MRAVIFGYFGTLTDPGLKVERCAVDAGVLYRLGTMWGPHVMRADALTTRRITSADG